MGKAGRGRHAKTSDGWGVMGPGPPQQAKLSSLSQSHVTTNTHGKTRGKMIKCPQSSEHRAGWGGVGYRGVARGKMGNWEIHN